MRATLRLPVLAAAVLATGCLVDVDLIQDPGPAFAAARREAARVQGLPGPAQRLNLLVYDRREGQLVRVGLPMRWIEDVDEAAALDLVGEGARVAERVRPHIELRELARAGLGVLVEVEEEDGDQVLVWLQ